MASEQGLHKIAIPNLAHNKRFAYISHYSYQQERRALHSYLVSGKRVLPWVSWGAGLQLSDMTETSQEGDCIPTSGALRLPKELNKEGWSFSPGSCEPIPPKTCPFPDPPTHTLQDCCGQELRWGRRKGKQPEGLFLKKKEFSLVWRKEKGEDSARQRLCRSNTPS